MREQSKLPRPRRPLPQTPEEMRAWSWDLAGELTSWPEVETRPMFGMLAFYRQGRIFACLPNQRAFYTAHTVIFKLEPIPPKLARRAEEDPRISGERALAKGAGWLEFEVRGPGDLRDVLWWFNEAHRLAGRSGPPKSTNPPKSRGGTGRQPGKLTKRTPPLGVGRTYPGQRLSPFLRPKALVD